MRLSRLAPLLAALALLGGCAATAPAPLPPGAITGRVAHIDVKEGIMIVEWPGGGQTYVMMDRRALGSYNVGDPVFFDQALRPLGRG